LRRPHQPDRRAQRVAQNTGDAATRIGAREVFINAESRQQVRLRGGLCLANRWSPVLPMNMESMSRAERPARLHHVRMDLTNVCKIQHL
jgi:hypothetical protein